MIETYLHSILSIVVVTFLSPPPAMHYEFYFCIFLPTLSTPFATAPHTVSGWAKDSSHSLYGQSCCVLSESVLPQLSSLRVDECEWLLWIIGLSVANNNVEKDEIFMRPKESHYTILHGEPMFMSHAISPPLVSRSLELCCGVFNVSKEMKRNEFWRRA